MDALSPAPGIAFTPQQQRDWLRLWRSGRIGPATFYDLINHFGTAGDALEALPDFAGRSGSRVRIAPVSEIKAELEALDRLGGRLVCLGEPDYPPALRAADGPPPVLQVLGGDDILRKRAVAFVGARNCSMAGDKLARKLARGVAEADYATVSGLARGIDAAAHEATVETGTIAVFAGGLDKIYPTQNEALAQAIVEKGGALVSEMPLGWSPRAQDFPRRNRIVAGIALGLVVVEAARRSGSLISARLAGELGRLVFAVPGSPLDPRSEGANHLIREGAILVRSSDDILQGLAPLESRADQQDYSLSERETPALQEPEAGDRERLLSALTHAPADIDELLRFTGLSPGAMQMLVLELDLDGTIERHGGNRISLT